MDQVDLIRGDKVVAENGDSRARCHFCGFRDRDIRRGLRLRRALRPDLTAMSFDYVLGEIVTVAIMVYLVYALIRPERF